MNDELLIASAGADLYRRGKLPANEDAAAAAIANHAAAYADGDVWFPILSASEAAALFQRDDIGLGGLGSALKKAVKKVGSFTKKVAPLAVGVTAGLASGNPQVGIGAMSLTGSLIGGTSKPKQLEVPGGTGQSTFLPQAYSPVAATNVEPMVLGIPQKFLPYVALGALALVMLARR